MAQARRRPPLSKLLRRLSASRLSRAAQGVLERDRRLTSLERHAVDSNDRDDLAHRRGREDFVCAEETLEWEDALDDLSEEAEQALKRLPAEERRLDETVETALSRAVKKAAYRIWERRPVVETTVLRV